MECSGCQARYFRSTGYARWLAAPADGPGAVLQRANYEYSWTPTIVLQAPFPMFEDAFIGNGRMQHTYELHAAGFAFYVVPDAWFVRSAAGNSGGSGGVARGGGSGAGHAPSAAEGLLGPSGEWTCWPEHVDKMAQHYYGHRLPEPLWVARRVWPAANDPDEGGPVCTSMQQASNRWSLRAAAGGASGVTVPGGRPTGAAAVDPTAVAPLGAGNAQAQTVVVVNACLYSEAHRSAQACQGPVDFLVRALPYHSTNKNFRYVAAALDETFHVDAPNALVVAVVTPPEAIKYPSGTMFLPRVDMVKYEPPPAPHSSPVSPLARSFC